MASFVPLLRALVLRPLLQEKFRSILTIAGIAVGVAVVVAIQLSNRSAIGAFEGSVEAISGRANYQIVSDATMVDERLLLRLQPLWEKGGRFAPVIDVEAELDPSGLPVRILAVDLLSDLHFRDYRYARIAVVEKGTSSPAEESMLSYLPLFQPASAIVPASFATEQKLRIGSPVVLRSGTTAVKLTVRGILQPTGPATAFNGSIVVMDIAAAQQAFGLVGKLSRIDLLLPEKAELVAEIQRGLPPNIRLERPSRRNERVDKMLRAFRVNLFALASVALLVGMFLVYNTVLISTLRRRRDVGILKTLGVSPGQILVAFLGEAALLGLIGSVAGLGLGFLLARSILNLVGRTVTSLYIQSTPEALALTPFLVLLAVACGTVVSILAAAQPALEASGLSPNAMIRPGLYQRIQPARTMRLAIAAMILFILAAAAASAPPVHRLPIGGYVSVALVVAAFSLLAPLVLLSVSRIMRRALGRMFSITGTLAAASLPASLRRVSVATAALALAIGMMVAVAVMIGSFRETVRVWVDQTVKSDLWLRPAKALSNSAIALFPDAISEDLKKFDFISAIDRFRGRDMVYQDDIISVGSGDFGVASSDSDLPMVSPRSSKGALQNAIRRGGVLVSESFALKFEKRIGDVVELPTAQGIGRFPITGIYRDYSNDRGVVVMDRPLYIRSFQDDKINTIAVFLKDGTNLDLARRRLEQELGAKYRAFTVSNREIRTEVMRIFDQTFKITYALLGVAIAVAVLGIVNTMSALILERRREIALLRVLGMSTGEIGGMIVLESSLIGFCSAVIGIVSGSVLAVLLIYVINRQSFGWTIEFHPPVAVVALSVIATFVTTVVAGFLPSRVAGATRMATELKIE